MLGGAIEGTVKIFDALKSSKKYKLLALSNWSAETFPIAQKRFKFLNEFDAVLLSGHEKLIKPDPRFFNLLVSRHSVIPSRAVFIDDVQKNIDGAKNLGFDAIRFENPDQLKRELKSRYIEVESGT
jgi:2-haloacid dehalogenase